MTKISHTSCKYAQVYMPNIQCNFLTKCTHKHHLMVYNLLSNCCYERFYLKHPHVSSQNVLPKSSVRTKGIILELFWLTNNSECECIKPSLQKIFNINIIPNLYIVFAMRSQIFNSNYVLDIFKNSLLRLKVRINKFLINRIVLRTARF